jgi:hypothetical protein
MDLVWTIKFALRFKWITAVCIYLFDRIVRRCNLYKVKHLFANFGLIAMLGLRTGCGGEYLDLRET